MTMPVPHNFTDSQSSLFFISSFRKNITKMWIRALLFSSLVSAVLGAPQSNAADNQNLDGAVPTAIRMFTRKTYFELAKKEEGNFVFSPYSIHMALSLLALGAPIESKTRKELDNLLAVLDRQDEEQFNQNYEGIVRLLLNLKEEDGVQIKLANTLYVAEGINTKVDYAEKIQKYFQSSVQNLDFTNPEKATETINKYVSDQTNAIIPEMFEKGSLDTLSKMVLVNAIYFKADWKYPFPASQTRPMSFNVARDKKIEYPYGMNFTQELRTADISELNSEILELPYKGGNLAMIIVLPKNDYDISVVDGLIRRFDTKLFEERLSFASEVEVILPRFEVTFDWTGLSDTMKNMSVKTLFDEDKANLTNISDQPLYVTKVVHKAVIKVGEEGSEAAAATGITIGVRASGGLEKKSFIVNRPFIFYIYDHVNNVPLFVGRINNPDQQTNFAKVPEDVNVRSDIVEGPKNPTDRDCLNWTGVVKVGLPCPGSDLVHILENQDQNTETENKRFEEAFPPKKFE